LDSPAVDSPAFRAQQLEHAYARGLFRAAAPALRALDLDCARGRVLALAGPNGSGKSTLLKLLAGLEAPRAGRLEVLGGDPRDSGVARRIGHCPQGAAWPGDLSFRDALELAGALRGLGGGARARAQEALEQVGLGAQARQSIARGSGGMVQRFALAQAFLHEPELLLLDEPTAGLDAEGFEAYGALLARAKARGATIVVASHLPSDLGAGADELVVLLDGRIAARGAPQELVARDGLLGLYARLRREQA
jgi:ABC-2 type transport system ATP-binding protein